ncbi:low molecular weight protein tyrosine phosphatase [Lentilactobacillus kosonis]|uniref:protein-tyrosine-phosphatase n=2 Tax=Lentilactobacillus kosonis TaxID=2810561 RepID=A0A401FPC4_9LACO|nr:low molecular weight protein tyrosine phosphatase [Lentilactobacillus kosonis]
MFRHMVAQQSLQDSINIQSAATSSYEQGNPPHPGAIAELAKHNLSMTGQFSRPITSDDFAWADLIIGMDNQNIVDLTEMAPKQDVHKIHLCLNILDESGKEIADPWYDHRFDRTYNQLASSLPAWLTYIKRNMLTN